MNVKKAVNLSASGEERVEVNQRALIDKILARYASAGCVLRISTTSWWISLFVVCLFTGL